MMIRAGTRRGVQCDEVGFSLPKSWILLRINLGACSFGDSVGD